MTAQTQDSDTALTSKGAALLSMLVPGLAHLRLGRPRLAVFAFLSCVGLYFAGWPLLGDRLHHFALVQPERGTWFEQFLRVLPIVQLPEVCNYLCTTVGDFLSFEPTVSSGRDFAVANWRMPRDHEHLAGFLTAASGLLSAFWAADAAFLAHGARPTRVRPALAAGVTWLVPGAGHWLAGQRGKGLLMGAAVLLVFGVGLLVSGGHAVDRGIQPVWWIGQCLVGGGTLFASLVTAPWELEGMPWGFDLGLHLCTVAGFMNLVVMVDVFTVAERGAAVATATPATQETSS